jgi:signal transduction histidine kinase
MKSEFISVASHELRTPLTSICNAVDLMLKKRAGEITDTQENFLSMARRNIVRLSKLINDILDVAKIESGSMELQYREADIGAIVASVIGTMKSLAEAKDIELSVEIQEGLPPIPMDGAQIEQVLLNLVGNAVKFTPGNRRRTRARSWRSPSGTPASGFRNRTRSASSKSSFRRRIRSPTASGRARAWVWRYPEGSWRSTGGG